MTQKRLFPRMVNKSTENMAAMQMAHNLLLKGGMFSVLRPIIIIIIIYLPLHITTFKITTACC